MARQISEQEINYAYGVFDALIEAINTATTHPETLTQLALELTQKSPVIFEAFMAIVKPEHRLIVYTLFKAVGGLIKSCSQAKKKS